MKHREPSPKSQLHMGQSSHRVQKSRSDVKRQRQKW